MPQFVTSKTLDSPDNSTITMTNGADIHFNAGGAYIQGIEPMANQANGALKIIGPDNAAATITNGADIHFHSGGAYTQVIAPMANQANGALTIGGLANAAATMKILNITEASSVVLFSADRAINPDLAPMQIDSEDDDLFADVAGDTLSTTTDIA